MMCHCYYLVLKFETKKLDSTFGVEMCQEVPIVFHAMFIQLICLAANVQLIRNTYK